ncbi:MAG: DNA binding protein [Microviridae sp. ctnrr37]|nr:MAG: DNA binding protein [Microviridae sp. ctnrr37]
MLFTVFSIYDSAIQTWMPPLYGRNKGEMLRNFADAVSDPGSKLAKHPGDFALFELGTWDDDKNIFDLHKAPIRLCMAIDFVKTPPAAGARGLGTGPQERSEATGASSGTK